MLVPPPPPPPPPTPVPLHPLAPAASPSAALLHLLKSLFCCRGWLRARAAVPRSSTGGWLRRPVRAEAPGAQVPATVIGQLMLYKTNHRRRSHRPDGHSCTRAQRADLRATVISCGPDVRIVSLRCQRSVAAALRRGTVRQGHGHVGMVERSWRRALPAPGQLLISAPLLYCQSKVTRKILLHSSA